MGTALHAHLCPRASHARAAVNQIRLHASAVSVLNDLIPASVHRLTDYSKCSGSPNQTALMARQEETFPPCAHLAGNLWQHALCSLFCSSTLPLMMLRDDPNLQANTSAHATPSNSPSVGTRQPVGSSNCAAPYPVISGDIGLISSPTLPAPAAAQPCNAEAPACPANADYCYAICSGTSPLAQVDAAVHFRAIPHSFHAAVSLQTLPHPRSEPLIRI